MSDKIACKYSAQPRRCNNVCLLQLRLQEPRDSLLAHKMGNTHQGQQSPHLLLPNAARFAAGGVFPRTLQCASRRKRWVFAALRKAAALRSAAPSCALCVQSAQTRAKPTPLGLSGQVEPADCRSDPAVVERCHELPRRWAL